MKTTNRSIKKLLQLTVSYIEAKTFLMSGICRTWDLMYDDDIITLEEYNLLEIWIEQNTPKTNWLKLYPDSSFFWERDDIPPRIAWLNRKINKL